MKNETLKNLVEFFALCGAIAFFCGLAEPWTLISCAIFGCAAAVTALFIGRDESGDKYSVFYYTNDGGQGNCEVSAQNSLDATKKAHEIVPNIKSIFQVIKLGVEL